VSERISGCAVDDNCIADEESDGSSVDPENVNRRGRKGSGHWAATVVILLSYPRSLSATQPRGHHTVTCLTSFPFLPTIY